MKLLVFGGSGQLGRELAARAGGAVEILAPDRSTADLTRPGRCAALIEECDADAVINAAAYTAVDRAEREEALASLINGVAPAAMARAAARRALPFVHVSTDYVFDGSGTAPWRPGDRPAPLSAYGRSKFLGERGVRAASGQHVILRTSWVFSPHGRNFVKSMLQLAPKRARLQIVADQIGCPTAASDLAGALLTIVRKMASDGSLSGIFHFAGAPAVSRAGFAREILVQAGLSTPVENITSRAFPAPARRPRNSRLDCHSLRAAFAIAQPDWRRALTTVVQRTEGP